MQLQLYNYGTLSINGTGIIKGSNEQETILNEGHMEINTGVKIQSDFNDHHNVTSTGTLILKGGELSLDGTKGNNVATCCIIRGGEFEMYSGNITSTAYGLVAENQGTTATTYGGEIIVNGPDGKTYQTVVSRDRANVRLYNTSVVNIGSGDLAHALAAYATVSDDEEEYGHLIVYNRSNNYGITGKVAGKIIATTNTGPGQSQESITIYDTDYQELFWPTWTSLNGQDDITWEWTSSSSTTHTYTVKKSSHKNETGEYIVHIYSRINGVATKALTQVILNF